MSERQPSSGEVTDRETSVATDARPSGDPARPVEAPGPAERPAGSGDAEAPARSEPTPAANGTAVSGTSPSPASTAPGSSLRPRPRPQPQPAGDDSPTVATTAAGSTAAEPTIGAGSTAGAAASGTSAEASGTSSVQTKAADPAPTPASGNETAGVTGTGESAGEATAAAGTGATGPGAGNPGGAAGSAATASTVPTPAPAVGDPRAADWGAEPTQAIPLVSRADGPNGTDRPASEQPTDTIPRAGGAAGGAAAATSVIDPPTEQFAATGGGTPPPGPPAGSGGGGGDDEGASRPKRRRRVLVLAGVVAVLALLYVGDLVFSTGNVPRGVTVAGLEIGGLSKAEATRRLQAEVEPRSSLPVQITAGTVTSQIDPKAAGLAVDYPATIDAAGAQPLNPITRVTSFFTDREVGVVNTADERSVTTALEQLAPVVDKDPVEGNVKFDGIVPTAVPPAPGQQLDLQAAVGVLERDWATGSPVALPLVRRPTITSPEDVRRAIDQFATPAVAAPVTVLGEGAQATLAPEAIAGALTFKADENADPHLVPEINIDTVTKAVQPQLAATEKPGRDATLDFSTGSPVIVPSEDGRGIDYAATFKDLVPVLTGQGARQVTAVYADQPAKITTDQIDKLGITGEISSFTTGGFAADSGQNIKRAADQINGTIVGPGETFSLNQATNPRNAANGYVEAGIIEAGHASRGIGGGVSQVATTTYNAAYFAGMVDVEHKEHSFYISRYPAGREATVFDDIIDLKFRNDGPTGVLIQTFWTPSSLTVKMFGSKRYDVTSTTGPRTNPTEPQTITIPPGEPCSPSKGAPGFTVTDTKTMRNVQTGEVTNRTRTVKYNPSPIVICGQ
jgi:vancomycin resistance protein YoaR